MQVSKQLRTLMKKPMVQHYTENVYQLKTRGGGRAFKRDRLLHVTALFFLLIIGHSLVTLSCDTVPLQGKKCVTSTYIAL